MSISTSVILTNFWDANLLINQRFVMYDDQKNKVVYKINLASNKDNKPSNFSVHSIALRPPPKNPDNIECIDRLDFFCPTYNMLCRYKSDNNWEAYTADYLKLLKTRKKLIKLWFDSLKPNWIYFLCCWENTATGAHCHRELMYKSFCESSVFMKKVLPIYRHGERIYKKEITNFDYQIETSTLYGLSPAVSHAIFNSQPLRAQWSPSAEINYAPVVPITFGNTAFGNTAFGNATYGLSRAPETLLEYNPISPSSWGRDGDRPIIASGTVTGDISAVPIRNVPEESDDDNFPPR